MAFVLLAALASAFGPFLVRRAKYFDHYRVLSEVAAKWKRTPRRFENYSFQTANGTRFSVSSAEKIVSEDYSTARYVGATPDPSRFFVVPPGKWVDTIDEVFAVVDEYD